MVSVLKGQWRPFAFSHSRVVSQRHEAVMKGRHPEEFLVEFQGSRVIEQEMARRLHSDLKRYFVLRSVARKWLVKTDNPSVQCELESV
jgi:hypothetical protein